MQSLELLVDALSQHWEEKQEASRQLSTISMAAYHDVKNVLVFLKMILAEHSVPSLEALDAVMKSKGGPTLLIAQVVTQQQYLSRRELRMRQQAVALMSYGADMEKAKQALAAKEEVSLTTIDDILEQLSVWMKAVSKGCPLYISAGTPLRQGLSWD